MKRISVDDILQYLPSNEADIIQYFGKIRNGKTYIATCDILSLLNSGYVVYANWKVQWNGRDEREELPSKILGFLGLKRRFFVFPKENFHYLPLDKEFFEFFPTITNAYVFLDEGHLVFNSYEKTSMDPKKQHSVLATGHYNRAIRIISQRPNNIHVQMRANVNVFVQCQKVFNFMGIRMFRKTFYEDMTANETVDLENPVNSKLYLGRKAIYNAYDTKYMRGDTPESQQNLAQIWELQWFQSAKAMLTKERKFIWQKEREQVENRPAKAYKRLLARLHIKSAPVSLLPRGEAKAGAGTAHASPPRT